MIEWNNFSTMMMTMYSELSEAELYLYSRQILLDEWDDDAQLKLKNSRVLLIGAGGLGCTSGEILARAGVGHLTIYDHDIIEISNLQRQIAFQPNHVGQYKANVLAEHLRQINPHIQVEAKVHHFDEKISIEELQSFDVVLDGCDRFSTRYLVNEQCKRAGVPLISASAIGLQGQLFMVEATSACYECLFPPTEQAEEQGSCASSGVLSSTPIVMASLQAHHTLLFLGLGKTPLREKLLLWNGITMQQKILSFKADVDCRVCQNQFEIQQNIGG